MTEPNATFHSLKPSGKWYATGRGIVEAQIWEKSFTTAGRRELVLHCNGGKFPGLNGRGNGMIFVVSADDDVDFGWPLLLRPTIEDDT